MHLLRFEFAQFVYRYGCIIQLMPDNPFSFGFQVPRPDKKEEDLGLKFLDEPSSSQSDPTVLELQLRAMSKKLQYGDVVVRSIENASKNPVAIEKWIQSVSDLHRSKPPPQVINCQTLPTRIFFIGLHMIYYDSN